MRQLKNTLYVFTEDAYLALNGKNVVVRHEGGELGRIPLHTLEAIVSFAYPGASPALMAACSEAGVQLSFCDQRGRFLASAQGEVSGNVLLRREQYRWADDPQRSLLVARNFVAGKVYNCRWVLGRCLRDHGPRVDGETMGAVCERLGEAVAAARRSESLDSLRGVEGAAADAYFSVFDQMLLRDPQTFYFHGRTRRPPTDPVNAMLSLFYSALVRECASALSAVGLDPYVGFMHTDRPGRRSLALDLMEELRPVVVDRFVITAVNNRVVGASCFEFRETGEVRLTDEGRRALFSAWQDRKRETMTHPFLEEKIPWGLVPFVQAQLLARCIRGDLDAYPPLLWK